jgi:hypothetical protein
MTEGEKSRLKTCHLCWKTFEFEEIEFHHISYEPEATVPICGECHTLIHTDEAVRPNLTPEMTRTEAEERGLISDVPEVVPGGRSPGGVGREPTCNDCGGQLVLHSRDREWFCRNCED